MLTAACAATCCTVLGSEAASAVYSAIYIAVWARDTLADDVSRLAALLLQKSVLLLSAPTAVGTATLPNMHPSSPDAVRTDCCAACSAGR